MSPECGLNENHLIRVFIKAMPLPFRTRCRQNLDYDKNQSFKSMGSANSLHASAYYSENNERFED